jgi:hypothetical protein
MTLIAKFTKDRKDVQDYDVVFDRWCTALSDSLTSFSVTADAGITLNSSTRSTNTIKVWTAGGSAGIIYNIYIAVTTTGGRTKNVTIQVQVT